RFAREAGVLVGGSAGLELAGALRYARSMTGEQVMVVLLPDSRRGYLFKIFKDGWMRDQGYIDRFGPRRTVADILPPGSRIVCASSRETVRDAIDRMHRFSISQMPVVKGDLPDEDTVPALDLIVGVIDERSLLERVF